MCIVPVFFAGLERLVGTEEKDEGKAIALALFGYMCQAGVDTSAIEWVVNLCAIGSNIMLCGLRDLISETEVATDVVVRFAELVMCEEFATGAVECMDSLLECCGIVVEDVLVLV